MRMMDAMMTGLEQAMLSFTYVCIPLILLLPFLNMCRLWNYNPDNDDQRGDDWNGENFSWFSKRRALPSSLLDYEQSSPTLDNGGRILRSVVRPYPAKTAGIPLRFDYDINTGDFTFEWVIPQSSPETAQPPQTRPSVHSSPRAGHPPLTSNITEIFVPSFIAHGGTVVVHGLSSADSYAYDEAHQTLYVRANDDTPGRVYNIKVSLSPKLRPVILVNDFWSDWGGSVLALGAVVLAVWAIVLTRML
jgi:hypothetical protein